MASVARGAGYGLTLRPRYRGPKNRVERGASNPTVGFEPVPRAGDI